MHLLKTKILTPEQEEWIDQFWNEEYPVKLANRYRLLLEDASDYWHHLLLDESDNIAGWSVEFEKGGEVRFSIVVPAACQGKGYGRMLLDSLKAGLDEFYGWVIDHDRDLKANGEIYRTPIPFYLKAGFEVLEDQRIESEMISAVKVRWRKSIQSQPTNL